MIALYLGILLLGTVNFVDWAILYFLFLIIFPGLESSIFLWSTLLSTDYNRKPKFVVKHVTVLVDAFI